MQDAETLASLKEVFHDHGILKGEVVQQLWSGYGEIARYYSPAKELHFVVKKVAPPKNMRHPRGWNTQHSHDRKIQSYQVEQKFYRRYAHQCDELCRVPENLLHNRPGIVNALVLEDLDRSGFNVRHTKGNKQNALLGIRWLAYFHGRFMSQNCNGLWPTGGYWHLATREDEWRTMTDGKLKQWASLIDEKLAQAKFQTLVHGDAKLANFCFNHGDTQVAALDFQYVGQGCGMKDLAYFLGGCFTSEELEENEQYLLREYFRLLHVALEHYNVELDKKDLEEEWRSLYCFAWADFNRFLVGWSPDHFKINTYMQSKTHNAIARLEGNA